MDHFGVLIIWLFLLGEHLDVLFWVADNVGLELVQFSFVKRQHSELFADLRVSEVLLGHFNWRQAHSADSFRDDVQG